MRVYRANRLVGKISVGGREWEIRRQERLTRPTERIGLREASYQRYGNSGIRFSEGRRSRRPAGLPAGWLAD